MFSLVVRQACLQPSWLRGFRGLVQVMCSWSPHEILMLCLLGLLYSPQFDLSRPSPSNEACYVLLSLLASTPCLVLFLVFPFVGVVPIETRHSTGLSGFIFLFFEYACLDFYIPSVWLVTSIPEQWGLLCPAQPLRSNPMFGSVLSVSFCGSSAHWNHRHSTGLSGFIFLFFEYACLISCHCFCCSHSVSLLSLFLALFIVFLAKKHLGQIWLNASKSCNATDPLPPIQTRRKHANGARNQAAPGGIRAPDPKAPYQNCLVVQSAETQQFLDP